MPPFTGKTEVEHSKACGRLAGSPERKEGQKLSQGEGRTLTAGLDAEVTGLRSSRWPSLGGKWVLPGFSEIPKSQDA